MSSSRERILATIRGSLGRGALGGAEAETLEARLRAPAPGPIPARAKLGQEGRMDLFVEMAVFSGASVARVDGKSTVPAALADYLAGENLPARVVMADDRALRDIPWSRHGLLEIRRGVPDPADLVGVTGAFAGIAETGTLMLVSGPESPTPLNFLPETHIVVLSGDRVVGAYEDGWARLRGQGQKRGSWAMPRTVNLITGPSRSADIELTLQLGAHGPRRLHVILIDGKGP